MLFTYELIEKGKESFTESEGVATLSKVMQESDDDELVDSVIEIFTSLITDGEFSFKLNKMLEGEGGKRWGGGVNVGWVICYLQSLWSYVEHNNVNVDSVLASETDLLLACHVSLSCDGPKEAKK